MKRDLSFLFIALLLAQFGCSHSEPSKTTEGLIPRNCNVKEEKAKTNPDKVRILIFGDSGMGSTPGSPNYVVAGAMEKACAQKGCDFAVGLGDNFYEDGVTSKDDPQFKTKFEIPYGNLNFPFYMVLGNHDYHLNPHAQVEYSSKRWKMPCEYYPVPNLPSWLTIFALDTNLISKEQTDQAKDVLCKQDGWKIAIGHHPLYSSGVHGGEGRMQSKVAPILKQCKVQFLFSGHDHHQEHLTTSSMDQIIQGAAGKLRPVRTTAALPYGVRQKFARSTFGFAIATFTKTHAQLAFFDDTAKQIYEFERRNVSALGDKE